MLVKNMPKVRSCLAYNLIVVAECFKRKNKSLEKNGCHEMPCSKHYEKQQLTAVSNLQQIKPSDALFYK